MNILTLRTRIYADAKKAIEEGKITQEQYNYMAQDDMYGAPYSFYGTALSLGLITQDEREAARKYYGNGWNYRGD